MMQAVIGNVDYAKARGMVGRIVKGIMAEHAPPTSMQVDDYIQQGLLLLMECYKKYTPGAASFLTYAQSAVKYGLIDYAVKQQIAPTSCMRSRKKKAGVQRDWGEISLEVLAENKGMPWEEFLTENEGTEVSFFTLTLDEAASVIKSVRDQIKNKNDTGISFVKKRNKFHVQVVIMGRQQFVGQFLTIEDARKAKSQFLSDFLDAVIDSVMDAPNAEYPPQT